MNIIVTGADGFVASYLIPRLIKDNHELLLIGKDSNMLKKKYNVSESPISYVNLDQKLLIDQIKDFVPNVVVHLATYYTASDEYSDMELLIEANILFLTKLLDALKNTNLDCFIYTGSCTEYYKGDKIYDPAYLYSATKTAGRSFLNYYADIYEFKTLQVIPYTVYGGVDTRKKIIDLLYDSLEAQIPVETTLGEQILDFIHVEDLVELFVQILEQYPNIPNKADIEAGTGFGYSLKHIAFLLQKYSGKETNIKWGGVPYRKKDTMHAIANLKSQKSFFSWKPIINIEDGIISYLNAKNNN